MDETINVESAPGAPFVEERRPEPCAMVIFGATGDLARRKLVPGLYNLAKDGLLPDACRVVALGRSVDDATAYRALLRESTEKFSRTKIDPAVWDALAARISYIKGDLDDPTTYNDLRKELERLDGEGPHGNRLYYFSVQPSAFPTILGRLREFGLIYAHDDDARGAPWSRIMIEKPFGRDLDSARALNKMARSFLDEKQIFRIDHYLGKETVQNILVFRFANTIFEPVWNRRYVDYVEICVAETEGVGTRGRFYEETGVLRDIVQNHMLEVLALTAMEPPNTSEADDVRGEKLQVLRALREPWADTIARDVVLGQYRGYRDEPDIARDSVTPTYAALRVFIDNWRWQGVPFYLRAGKRLAKRITEVSLHMKRVPLSLFGRQDVCENLEPNVLTLRIQPDEGIRLHFASKIPGFDTMIATVAMDMSYLETFGGEPPEAYERLLLDAMRGDATLFSRRDAVEASWRWITPILQYFESQPPVDFPNYDPGSWGPFAAQTIPLRDGHGWRPL
jgi:glucose-6-phosphate 1-dehydrogenase